MTPTESTGIFDLDPESFRDWATARDLPRYRRH